MNPEGVITGAYFETHFGKPLRGKFPCLRAGARWHLHHIRWSDLVSLNQSRKIEKGAVDRNDQGLTRPGESKGRRARITKRPQPEQSTGPCRRSEPASDYKAGQDAGKNGGGAGRWRRKCMLELM